MNITDNYLSNRKIHIYALNADLSKFMHAEKNNLTNLSKNKPREFWKTIKKQYLKKDNSPNNLNTTALYEHFKQLYSDNRSNTENSTRENNPSRSDPDLDKDISLEEVTIAIHEQKNNKSSGIDKICAEIYKHSIPELSSVILALFNRMYKNSECPKSWSE